MELELLNEIDSSEEIASVACGIACGLGCLVGGGITLVSLAIDLIGVASWKCGFHTLRAFSPLIPMVCRLFRYSKVYIVP